MIKTFISRMIHEILEKRNRQVNHLSDMTEQKIYFWNGFVCFVSLDEDHYGQPLPPQISVYTEARQYLAVIEPDLKRKGKYKMSLLTYFGDVIKFTGGEAGILERLKLEYPVHLR